MSIGLDLLEKELGFVLKSEQREALELLLREKDVFCVLPTGTLNLCAKSRSNKPRRTHFLAFKGAMSPMAHALASENKLEKDGPSFSSSVGDFGRLFLAVEISAIIR